jgi:hypothetical protein
VEQRQVLNDNSSNISSSNFNSVTDQVSKANSHHEKPLVDKETDNSLPEEPIPEVIAKQSVSTVNIPVMDQCDQKSLEDKETDTFLDEVHNKKVSNEIRQRKRKKKLQGELIVQDSSPAINTSCEADLSMTSTELVTLPEQVVEESIPKESSAEPAIPCELNLLAQLLEFIRCHDFTSLPNSISSKHIPDVPVDANLTPGSVPHLAHLFDKAERTFGRWYHYSEEYEKKAVTLSSENNISDQMARTQIYDEIELYLPGKKREYLHKMTQKAKNIYMLVQRNRKR